MRILKAKYDGHCRGCGGDIRAGEMIAWAGRGQTYHASCAPSQDSAADREYWQGRAEGNAYSQNRQIYGDELAEQWEMEREMQEDW